jgi:hypothetical protein|tara:strand:+ start:807 stop:1478 length:672 start_codon:yes stop_codon:yes gene_type:complete
MKTFNYVRAPILAELSAEITDVGRMYTTPEGNIYPSVTTVLSDGSKKGIEAWKARVGAEEARKISYQASLRGTAVHSICEDYLKNDSNYSSGRMPNNMFSFRQIQPILDKHVDNIHYLEAPLYSDYLKVAGRVDCIAEYDGKLSIVDFKTSRRSKKIEWITNYFMQESAYAVMYEERTGIPVSQLVTIITVDDSESQVFVQQRDDHIFKFMEQSQLFKKKYNV